MLDGILKFAPMEVPDVTELKPVERAFLNGIRNLEISVVKMSVMWLTALLMIGIFWGIGGYLFYNKLDEFSDNSKNVAEMKIELRYLKEDLKELKKGG